MAKIHHDDPRLAWRGAVSIERSEQWSMPWRIDCQKKDLFPPKEFIAAAAHSTGVRLAFRSDTRKVAVQLESFPEMLNLDLVIDGKDVRSSPELNGNRTHCFEDLPPGPKNLELWLPHFGETRLNFIEISDGAFIEPLADRRPVFIAHGSSVTRCRGVWSPTQTWPAIVARELDWNHYNWGYGGHSHLEPMLACELRDRPWDILSLKIGANIQIMASLSVRTFQPAVLGFLSIVREKHPREPIVVLSPLFAKTMESTPNAIGMTYEIMRREIETAVETLKRRGDQNLYYVHGFEFIGPAEEHLIKDTVHPTPEGYTQMGKRFVEKVAPVLKARHPGLFGKR